MEEIDRQCGAALDEGEAGANRDVCLPLRPMPMSDEDYQAIGESLARFQQLVRDNANFVKNLIDGQMAFRPMTDRVVVFAVEAAEKSEGGVYYPEASQDHMRTARGIVAGIGPGRHLDDGSIEPIPLKLGQWVQFGRFAGQRMEAPHERPQDLKGIVMIILRLADIHGVWEPRSQGDDTDESRTNANNGNV